MKPPPSNADKSKKIEARCQFKANRSFEESTKLAWMFSDMRISAGEQGE